MAHFIAEEIMKLIEFIEMKPIRSLSGSIQSEWQSVEPITV